jgi:hypothetical protein
MYYPHQHPFSFQRKEKKREEKKKEEKGQRRKLRDYFVKN